MDTWKEFKQTHPLVAQQLAGSIKDAHRLGAEHVEKVKGLCTSMLRGYMMALQHQGLPGYAMDNRDLVVADFHRKVCTRVTR